MRRPLRCDRAIADFNEAIGLDPKFVLAIYSRGLAWEKKGDLQKALADRQFAKVAPSDPDGAKAIKRVSNELAAQ